MLMLRIIRVTGFDACLIHVIDVLTHLLNWKINTLRNIYKVHTKRISEASTQLSLWIREFVSLEIVCSAIRWILGDVICG